jgi:hypothetical protein
MDLAQPLIIEWERVFLWKTMLFKLKNVRFGELFTSVTDSVTITYRQFEIDY